MAGKEARREKATEPSTTVTSSSDAASWARVAYFVCVALAAGILAAWFGAIGAQQKASAGLHISYFLGFSVAMLSAWIVRRSRREYLAELTDLDQSMEKIRTDAVATERLLGLLREMTEDAGVGWYRMSADGRLENANLALAITLGFNSVEALRKACKGNSFTGTTDRTSALSTLQTIGEIRNHEAGWPTANGRRTRLIESARAVRDAAGQIQHIEGVAIAASGSGSTERRARKAEAALAEAMEKLGRLQNGHEPVEPEAVDEISVDVTDMQPADSVADPVVDLPTPSTDTVSIRTLVEKALEQSARPAVDRRVELAYRLASDLPTAVHAESDTMQQALDCLVEYAVRSSGRGSVVVHASIGSAVDGDALCQFEIRGSEAAVSVAELERTFEADDLATSGSVRGGGGDLTAAIGRQLVEHLSGGLRLETSPEGRFTVHMAIPVRTDPDVTPVSADDTALRDTRVLLVDDNDTSRSFLTHLLESSGAAVHATGRSADAADLEHGDVDVDAIVASLSSARGAAEFVSHLKRIDASRRPPLVLVVPPDMGEASSEGRSRMAKPVRRARLVQAVLSAIGDRVRKDEPAAEASPGPEPAPGTGLDVLVADDDPVNGYLMVRILENLGHEVTLVTSGPDAVEAFTSRAFDVAIMDVRMPRLSGPDATRRILENIGPDRERPLLLGMTASTSDEDREICIAAGMHACLVKPVTPDDFAAAVESFHSREAVDDEAPRPDRPARPPAREKRSETSSAVPIVRDNGAESRPRTTNEAIGAMEEVRSYLEAHHGDEPAFMAELLAVYLRNTPGLIRTMRDHLEAREFDTVRQSAQALKSSCRLIGFVRLSALCRALEVAVGEDASYETIAPFVESIEETFARVRAALDSERAELVHLAALQTAL